MEPQKIGRYEIKSELGRGGMATVYKAYDPRFEREVALKVLPREMMHDANFRVRFEREAKTIASLEHPAIVPVYDVGEEDEQPYFVMRYMTGGSLADEIEKGPVPIKEAAKLMDRLGPALDQAHSKGIIHRDLKPGNILFDRAGEPYVSDFGIAKIAQGQSTTVTGGAIIGTPAYMSPEQAQGEPLDGRSDIYALGVILYEMLAGSQPYQATTPMAVVVKHITDPIPHILDVNPRLPAGIEVIIEKAMAKNPDDRFATAGEFAAALNALAAGETVETALKTATMSVTRNQAAKTRMAGRAEATKASTSKGGGISPLAIVVPVVGVVVVGALLVVGYFMFGSGLIAGQPPTATAAVVIPGATTAPVVTASPQGPTATLPAVPVDQTTPTDEPKAAGTIIGGADSVAFIANNEVWLMNLDGSNLKQLTNDKAAKTDLHWMPNGRTLVFISGKNINTVDSTTGRFDTIMTFSSNNSLDAFRISPDGRRAAISLNLQMFIVPFNLDVLKNARSRGDLKSMKTCLTYEGGPQTAVAVRQFSWSADGKIISWLFTGVGASNNPTDLIRVQDISACDPTKIDLKDEFPGTRFIPIGYTSHPDIFDFDWDGNFLFLFNSNIRNNGWGYLYSYSYDIRKATQLDVLTGKCCYRDARWSPDGTYIFFAFQDIALGDKGTTTFYYVPAASIGTGAEFTPIPLPDDFKIRNQREAPQPALHAAQP